MTAWNVTVKVLSQAILPPAPAGALSYIHKVNVRPALLERRQQVSYLCCSTELWQLRLHVVLCMTSVLLDKGVLHYLHIHSRQGLLALCSTQRTTLHYPHAHHCAV